MIDYEKLRQAHKLVEKYSLQIDSIVQITLEFNSKCNQYNLRSYFTDNEFLSIDDLINRLQELTQPEPKYKGCLVDECQEIHQAKGYCAMHYMRMKNHGDYNIVKQKGATKYQYASLEEYFDRKTRKESNGCLMWMGATDQNGYGNISTTRWGKQYGIHGAHRMAYFYYKGKIPKEMEVCHSCDNPACVNPDHLFLGSHQENMRDMSSKGRASDTRGQKGGRAKLTKDQAIYILQNIESKTVYDLASEFDVCIQTIRNIWHGITKYIEPEMREKILKCPKFEGLVEEFNDYKKDDLENFVCEHEYKKTVDKSGTSFISMCHKCYDSKPWVPCRHESDNMGYYSARPDILPGELFKCKKCGEFYR